MVIHEESLEEFWTVVTNNKTFNHGLITVDIFQPFLKQRKEDYHQRFEPYTRKTSPHTLLYGDHVLDMQSRQTLTTFSSSVTMFMADSKSPF